MFENTRDRIHLSAAAVTAADQRWVRPAPITLLVATAAFWTVGLNRNGWANAFYSAAVQAGTKNWKAFLFGSSDAANSITVDKPPASLWPMEIVARIFGVNTWSIQLPQLLFGVASVALLYVIVKRHFGPAAGLIAGLVLAVTPVATLMFRYNNPDALLTFLMIGAVWALMRAVGDGRTRWLLLCGALIGFGFLTKQLQVLLVVPALALTYLLAGSVGMWKRIGQLSAALAAMVVAAGWWVVLVSLTPAAQRPYIGGSTDNSFLNLTFGYNGLSRLTGGGSNMPVGGEMSGGPGPSGATAGITRMFTGESGGQISWLLPAALIFLVIGLVLCGSGSRTDGRRAQYVVWGGWLLGTAVVFSFMSGIFHDYYTVALAPAVAALVGIGVTHLWSGRHKIWVGSALSATVAVTAAWAWVLLERSPDFVPALRWMILVGGVAAALALAVAVVRPARTSRRKDFAVWAAAVGAVAALGGPVAYSIQTVTTAHKGPIITAGPAVNGAMGFPGMRPGAPGSDQVSGTAATDVLRNGPPDFTGWDDTTVTDRITSLLSRDADRYTWVAAIDGAISAAAYQLATEEPVMPIGGFFGMDPSPTLEQFQGYVSGRRIHYYIAGGMGPMMSAAGGATDATNGASFSAAASSRFAEAVKIAEWVEQHHPATSVDGVTLYDLTTPSR